MRAKHPQSVASFASLNFDNENARRFQESIKIKQELNKELKEKLLVIENDCHLQSRKA